MRVRLCSMNCDSGVAVRFPFIRIHTAGHHSAPHLLTHSASVVIPLLHNLHITTTTTTTTTIVVLLTVCLLHLCCCCGCHLFVAAAACRRLPPPAAACRRLPPPLLLRARFVGRCCCRMLERAGPPLTPTLVTGLCPTHTELRSSADRLIKSVGGAKGSHQFTQRLCGAVGLPLLPIPIPNSRARTLNSSATTLHHRCGQVRRGAHYRLRSLFWAHDSDGGAKLRPNLTSGCVV